MRSIRVPGAAGQAPAGPTAILAIILISYFMILLDNSVIFTGFTRLEPDAPVHADIDAAYHAKYDRYGQAIVGTVTGDHSTPTTLRLVPHE